MPVKEFSVKHMSDTKFEPGLRPFLEYRYLGLKEATDGRVTAWHLRKRPGIPFPEGKPHRHHTQLQFVYVLKGWIDFEYEGYGRVRLEAGSCAHQPPQIRHRELGCSEDLEILEIVMPADFKTEEVPSVEP
jgi:quercetin dioxygenase-like cupin family protein